MTSTARLLSCPVLVRRVLSVQQLLSTDHHPPCIVIAGEKGIVNAQIEVRTEGGHSSIPRTHTSIGLLSRIVASIECVCLQLAFSEGVSRADACQLSPPQGSEPLPPYAPHCLSHLWLPQLHQHAWHAVPRPFLYVSHKSLHPALNSAEGPSRTAGLIDGLKGKHTQKALDKLAKAFADVRGREYGEFLVRTSKALTLFQGGIKLVSPFIALPLKRSRDLTQMMWPERTSRERRRYLQLVSRSLFL